jgi:uncharacterized protein with GYD domain
MTHNPQDRAAAAAKVAETFGGKSEAAYFFPMGGEFDEAIQMAARSTGALARVQVVPITATGEFKTLMEAAKQGAASYTPPGR